MKENELQVDSTGIWLKTRRENIQLWRSLFKEVLKLHGYQLFSSTPYKDTYHVTSLHHRVHAFTSFERLVINVFTNGNIRIETENQEKFFKKILPHLEHTLDVNFRTNTPGEELRVNTPVLAYFSKRDGLLPPIGWQVTRRAHVNTEVQHLSDVDDVAYGRMENQIAHARKELSKAKDTLTHVDEKLTDVSSELFVFNETRRDKLRACVGMPASYPSLGCAGMHAWEEIVQENKACQCSCPNKLPRLKGRVKKEPKIKYF